MNKTVDSAPPMRSWTTHDDLNQVLHLWLERLHALLGRNLAGAYLQGSLALGDFDAACDVDFLVVLHDDIPATAIDPIRELHASLCRLTSPLARELEGSYASAFAIRRLCTVSVQSDHLEHPLEL